jgi:hypothetical protein
MRGNFTVMINEINELLKNILSIINKYTVETDHDQEALNVMLYAMGKISDTVKRFGNNHINWMKKILSINLEGDRKQLDLRRNKIRELMNKKRKSLIYLYLTEYKGYAKVLIENYKGISLNEIFEVYNKLNNSEHSALINEIDSFQNILNEELFLIAVLENLGNNMPLSDRIMRYQTKISVYLNILTGIELLTTYIKINEERGEEEFVYYERLARLEKSLEDANNGLDFSDEDQKMFELILNLLWVNENKKNISLRQKKEFKNKIFALLNFNFHI